MTEQMRSNTAESGPRSWKEDLHMYRASRGSQSFSALNSSSQGPKRFTRTGRFEESLTADGRPSTRLLQDPEVTSRRWYMHGWGDTSLLKQDGFEGMVHPHGIKSGREGRASVAVPKRDGGRYDLYGILSGTEAEGLDAWMGNPGIDPRKGRRAVPRMADAKGRTDLFELMQRRDPGRPEDDAWIGNMHIDPGSGKAHPPPPARGRGCLKEIIEQSIVTHPLRHELMKKGADPIGDAWCGNKGMTPNMGRGPVKGAVAAHEHLKGATFKGPIPEGWSDLRRRHLHHVPPPVPDDPVGPVLLGTASLDAGERSQKRPLPTPLGHAAFKRTDNLYSHMTYRPLSEVEQKVYSKGMDDAGGRGRAHANTVPGSIAHGKGPDMLAWRPEQQLGSFVPRGGLMQDGRRTRPGKNPQGGTIRSGTAPSMLSRF